MIEELDLAKVAPKPNQPRQQFDPDALRELAHSIQESGLLVPILVRPTDDDDGGDGYEIIHGERRWRACQLAGIKTIRAEVRRMSDKEAYTASVIENEQRADLSPAETAHALAAMKEEHNLTDAEIGERIGRSRSWVTQKLRLLKLPDAVMDEVKNGNLTESHSRQLLKLQNAGGDTAHLAARAASESWSVNQLQAAVENAMGGDSDEPARTATFFPDDLTRTAEAIMACMTPGQVLSLVGLLVGSDE